MRGTRSGAKVEQLLRGRKTLRHVHAMGVFDVLAKPHVELLLRGRNGPHRRLDVLRFDEDDHDVAVGRALKPVWTRLVLALYCPAISIISTRYSSGSRTKQMRGPPSLTL